jgi:cell division protein FtsA
MRCFRTTSELGVPHRIGGGTTDIVAPTAQFATAVIPIAGDQVTNDIAMALRTPTPNAEEIKIKYARVDSARTCGRDDQSSGVGERRRRSGPAGARGEPRYDELSHSFRRNYDVADSRISSLPASY